MADPTLTAQLAQANAILATLQLPQGMTLAGDAFIKDDQIVVPIANDNEGRSEIVPLETLTGCSGNHFNVPSAFRVQASRLTHDASLDRSFDPTDPDNLDEILRQLASDDPTQRRAGYEAMETARADAHRRGPAAEAEFERRVTEARQRIALEHPEEAPQVDQTYQDYRSGHYEAPAAQPSNNGGNSGLPSGSGGSSSNGSAAASGGGSPVVARGTVSGATVDLGGMPAAGGNDGVMLAGFMPGVSEGTLFTTASFLPGAALPANDAPGARPTTRALGEDGIAVPAAVYFAPTTVTLRSESIPAVIGGAAASGRGPEFFQSYFASVMNGGGPTPVVAFLTQPTPETRPYIESVRQATETALRNYWTQPRIGAWSLESAHQPVDVEYRYDEAARGIVVSVVPSGARSVRDGGILDGLHDDGPVNPFDRLRRFTGVSLARFRVGVDGVRREADSPLAPPPVTVLIPFAVFAGIRVANDVRPSIVLRPNGAATDQAPSRIAQRGNSGDQRGGNGRGDRQDGRSRGGQGGNPQQDQTEEEILAMNEDGTPRETIAA